MSGRGKSGSSKSGRPKSSRPTSGKPKARGATVAGGKPGAARPGAARPGNKMRSGFVSVVGRPNAGKSTLVNALTGEKVAIVTSKPQTTRNRIHGIVDVAAKKGKRPAAQIVFVDTPGVHKPGNVMDRRMLQEVHAALESRDVVMWMVDASRRIALPGMKVHEGVPGEEEDAGGRKQRPDLAENEDAFVFELVKRLDCPVILVINKIDLVEREKLVPLIAELSGLYKFAEVFPISARKRKGTEELLEKLVEYLPEGQRYFEEGQFTDQPERFLVAELIRERILMETGEEVPYASAVLIEQYEEAVSATNPLTRIAAAIYCERPGQKAILIGKGGAKLKEIGASARKEIEGLLGTRVYLELHVKVKDRWRESQGFVEGLDWRRQLEDLE